MVVDKHVRWWICATSGLKSSITRLAMRPMASLRYVSSNERQSAKVLLTIVSRRASRTSVRTSYSDRRGSDSRVRMKTSSPDCSTSARAKLYV